MTDESQVGKNVQDQTPAQASSSHIQHRPRHERKAGISESARQSFIVMKNEIKKFFSGKRMLVFAILMFAIIFIITIAPYLIGSTAKPYYFVSMASLIVLMAATLFASISIVSEDEERTALIVFTRPISKTSIFFGKMLACLTVTIGFTMIYYLVAIIVGLIIDGKFDADMVMSFAMACAYAFGCTGIAMLVSSLMKKGSTSTIITFVILAVVFMAISIVISAAGQESGWLLNQAAGSIETASTEYRDVSNEMIDQIMTVLADPTQFLRPGWMDAFVAAGYDPAVVVDILKQYWVMSPDIMGDITIVAPDYVHDAITMIVWGVIGLAGAFVAFIKREF